MLASVHYFAQTQAIILGGAYMAQKHKSHHFDADKPQTNNLDEVNALGVDLEADEDDDEDGDDDASHDEDDRHDRVRVLGKNWKVIVR